MSWKLFWQIALLMLIGALLLCTLKCALLSCKRGYYKGKCLKSHSGMTHKEMMHKDTMRKSRKK